MKAFGLLNENRFCENCGNQWCVLFPTASSKRVESIDSKASIIKDVNQNSSSKDPAGSSQQSKDDGEEGKL